MIDVGEVKRVFAHISALSPISGHSGQKYVFTGDNRGKKVVLKLIKPNPGFEKRIEREINAVSKLRLDNIPKILDHGSAQISNEQILFLVEEYVAGETLRAVLQKNPKQSTPFALNLGLALTGGCVKFEKSKIVHRDLKPENIIIGGDGKVWIIDFGLARHLDLDSVTDDGPKFGVGTLGYAPQEQFNNWKSQINSRADLFSIGIILYEAIIGYQPYLRGMTNQRQILDRMEREDLPKLSIYGDPRDEFSEFISLLTMRFPSRRIQTAKEAYSWLEPIYRKILTSLQ